VLFVLGNGELAIQFAGTLFICLFAGNREQVIDSLFN
jgi:hypothetical protein